MSIEVKLSNFEGPLDLLLHLIHENEIDIYDIPISMITDQYLVIIEAQLVKNLDVASEFMVMAATLIEIKSKMLLPIPKEKYENLSALYDDDPRTELVNRLLEYRKYKDAANTLFISNNTVYTRDDDVSIDLIKGQRPNEPLLMDMEVLANAFSRMISRIPNEDQERKLFFNTLKNEEFKVSDKIEHIKGLLKEGNKLLFTTLLQHINTKNECVTMFLAVLELIKLRQIIVFQTDMFDDIHIVKTEFYEEIYNG